jgi:hypothetical protein
MSKYYDLTKSEQDAMLMTAVKRFREFYEDLDDDDLNQKLLGFLIMATFLYPGLDVGSTTFSAGYDMIISIFRGDDYFDDEDGLPIEADIKLLFKRRAEWERVCAGEFEVLADAGHYLPPAIPFYNLLLNSIKKAETVVPNLRTNMESSMREVMLSTQALFLMQRPPGGDGYSEEGLRVLRGYDAGMCMLSEYGIALRDIHLPKYVRDTLLFRMFQDGVRLFSALINDVLGLNKDIKNSATKDNVILRKVVNAQMSLGDSFREELARLQNTLHDMQISGKLLVEAFPDEEAVAPYVQHCFQYCEGQNYWYMLLSKLNIRYGSMNFEIVSAN